MAQVSFAAAYARNRVVVQGKQQQLRLVRSGSRRGDQDGRSVQGQVAAADDIAAQLHRVFQSRSAGTSTQAAPWVFRGGARVLDRADVRDLSHELQRVQRVADDQVVL